MAGKDHGSFLPIRAEWREISCAKRSEIIPDGLAAASMRQIFAPETSLHSALIGTVINYLVPILALGLVSHQPLRDLFYDFSI